MGNVRKYWKHAWAQKPMYVTPRDRTQLMRLQRRNLWVAQHGGCDHTTCAVHGMRSNGIATASSRMPALEIRILDAT
eukprot:574611-Prymnesium_polylepis.3